MTHQIIKRTILILVLMSGMISIADDVTIVPKTSEAAEGLDLGTVAQLIQDVENPEALERALNDPELGINNLDLDDNGEVDFIRVLTQEDGDTRVLVLQVPLDIDQFQDVATIEIDRDENQEVSLQIHGNEYIYGPDYYVVPSGVAYASIGFVSWMYSPRYRPYRSTFYYGYYPRWYNPWPVVSINVYRPRVKVFTRTPVRITHTTHVHRANVVYRTPAVSVKVRKPVHRHTTNVNVNVNTKGHKHGVKTQTNHSETRKGAVVKSNPKSGTKTAVGVKKDADGNKTVKAKQVKKQGNTTKTTTYKKKKTDKGTKTTVKKTKKTKTKNKTKTTKVKKTKTKKKKN